MRKTFKKIATIAMAAIMTVGCAVSAFAADSYDGCFSFAAADWSQSVWGDTDTTKTTITGEGTYTFSHTFASAVTGAQVFVIDIKGAGEAYASYVVTDLTVKLDGVDLPVDESKVVVGDTEENGNLRISLYNPNNANEIGTPADAPFAYDSLTFTSIEVSLTIDDPATVPETDNDTDAGNDTDTDADTNTDTDTDADSNADSNADADANANAGATTPDTGDSSMVAMYGLVALVAAAVVLKRRTVTE